MSSSPLAIPLIVLMALALQLPSVADLLTRDEVQQAEALLDNQPRTAEYVASVDAPQNPAPIPLRKSLNLVFARVMINGRGPYEFAVDTGASQIVLSEKLAGDLGLTPVTSTIMHGVGGGGKIDTKLYSVKEMTIGDVKIKNVPVGTFNDPLVTQLADGIFSTAVLSDFILTVNYPGNQLEISRKRPAANPDHESLPAWDISNLPVVPV